MNDKLQLPTITPHVCRHTYCTNMAKSGMNPKALQYLMGHSDISVTLNVYTHVKFEDAKAEKEAGERPAIKGKVENMAQYDVVFVCVPVWWYTAPMPVFTFLEQYDLSGKTVIPFCTAYSGPSSTLRDIVSATPKSNHRDGICVVTKEMGGKDMEQKHPKIDKWLTEIGF